MPLPHPLQAIGGGGRLEARPILKKDDATILLWAAGKGTAKIV
jgi:hypothetical protein